MISPFMLMSITAEIILPVTFQGRASDSLENMCTRDVRIESVGN